jgi:DNA-binding MarR family transcriptional regulator
MKKRSNCMERDSKQRVGLVPARYLDHPELGALELVVLLVLCAHANRLGVCWPSQTTIAAKTKLDRSTVNRALGKLVGLGLIEKGRHLNPKIRACTYRLIGHEMLMEDFLNSIDRTAEETPAEATIEMSNIKLPKMTVAVGHTEHFEHSKQDSLPPERASAPEGERVFDGYGKGKDSITPIDEAWVPNLADMTFAQTHRADLTAQEVALVAQKFLLHYRSRRITDPSALFRRWLLTERKSHDRTDHRADLGPTSYPDNAQKVRHRGGAATTCSGQTRFDAWAQAASERRARYTHVG